MLHNSVKKKKEICADYSIKAEIKETPLPYLYYGTGTNFFLPRKGNDIYPEFGNIYVHLYDNVLSANNIWLTDRVPAEYLEKMSGI